MPFNNCLRTKRDHRIQHSLSLAVGRAQERMASGVLEVRTPVDPWAGWSIPVWTVSFLVGFRSKKGWGKTRFLIITTKLVVLLGSFMRLTFSRLLRYIRDFWLNVSLEKSRLMSLFIYFVELFLSQGISAFIRDKAIVMRKQVYIAISQDARTAHLCRACTGRLPSAMALGPLRSPGGAGRCYFAPFTDEACHVAPRWRNCHLDPGGFLQSSCSY